MSKRVQLPLVGLVCFLLGWLVAPQLPWVRAQEAAKGPKFLHGLDLKVRKGGETDFTDKTPKIGVEVFRDENNGNWIYISETGSLTVVPGDKTAKAPTPSPKEPVWTHGLDLKCRRYGEAEFSPKTRVFGVEVFRDENTNTVLYISEIGAISAVPTK